MTITYEPCTEEGEVVTPQKLQRRANPIFSLASWFADKYLNGGWYAVNQGAMLKAATSVVKGYTNQKGVTYPPHDVLLVRETIEALENGAFGFDRSKLTSLWVVNWGEPTAFIERVSKGEHIPTPCPVWHESDYNKWQKRWGDSYVKFCPDYKQTLDEWRRYH